MKIIKTVIKYGAIASLALATTAVFAASPEYTYVEAAYVNTDFDGIGDDDGWGIGGSAEVGENIFIFADYSSIGLPAGVDFNVLDAGIGYKSPISPTTDINLSIGYVNFELDTGLFGSADEDGYSLDATIRSMVSNEFELNGGISYIDLGNGNDDPFFHVGAVYSFNPSFAVFGDFNTSSDITTYMIGGRFYIQ